MRTIEVIKVYWLEWGLGLISGILALGYRQLARKMKTQKIENDAIKAGVRALLRDRIVQAYNNNMDKGYWPIYSREAVVGMFEEYHALGGNGVVGALLDKMAELPTKNEE